MNIGIVMRKSLIKGKISYSIYNSYVDFFNEKEIVVIPIFKYNLENTLNLCDGFVIPGGDDINPLWYQQKNKTSYGVDDEMDYIDFKVIDYCHHFNKPLLGICRGIQVINVFYGGSLKQDESNHMNTNHAIKLNDNYIDYVVVNSYHHQIINQLGNDLKILGKCKDIIEYIEHKNKPIIGVQFHIEKMKESYISKYIKQQFLFYIKCSKMNKRRINK